MMPTSAKAAETYNVALIAMAMTTTITMVTMKADRAEANANPVAVIRRKSTHSGLPPASAFRH
jgi:hypothetical protein